MKLTDGERRFESFESTGLDGGATDVTDGIREGGAWGGRRRGGMMGIDERAALCLIWSEPIGNRDWVSAVSTSLDNDSGLPETIDFLGVEALGTSGGRGSMSAVGSKGKGT